MGCEQPVVFVEQGFDVLRTGSEGSVARS
jgi:hypothetical protein